MRPHPIVAFVLCLALAAAGCSVSGDLLGGRQKCWSESDPRLAALMRGTLELDFVSSILATPEGDRLPLGFPSLAVRSGESGTLVVVDANGGTVATDGEVVTVFGGMGSDGVMSVCAIEERHGSR